MNIDDRVIDALSSGILAWIFSVHIKAESKLSKTSELMNTFQSFRRATDRALVSKNKKQDALVIQRYNGVMKLVSKYIYKELKGTRKALQVVNEWVYSLDKSKAISIGKLGYGDVLNEVDDIFANNTNDTQQKSIDKQMQKLHKIINKVITIWDREKINWS